MQNFDNTLEIIDEIQLIQQELVAQNEELIKTHAQLDATVERYFDLYDTAPVGYGTVDFNGNIIEANLTLANLLGESKENLIGNHMNKYICTEDVKLVKQKLYDLFTNKTPQEMESKVLKVDGTTFWAHLSATYVINREQTPTCRIVVVDISKRRESEIELQKTDARYRSIIEASPDALAVTDLTGKILMISPTAVGMIGATNVESLIGTGILDFLSPEDKVIAYGHIMAKIQGADIGVIDYNAHKLDGTKIKIEVNSKILREPDGTPYGIIMIIRDCTIRTNAEEEILKWVSIFKNAKWGVAASTGNSRYLDMINQTFADMHGYTLRELKGTPIINIIAPEYKSVLIKALENQDSNDHVAMEIEHIRKDGSIFPVLSDITLIRDGDGNVLHIAINIQDITARKIAEEQIAKSERELHKQNETFKTLLELIPMGIYMEDTNTKRPIIANEEAYRLLGKGIFPEQTGSTEQDKYDVQKHEQLIPYNVDEMPLYLAYKGITSHIDDMVIVHPNKKINLEVYGTPVRDEEGKVWASLTSFMDITERKKISKKIKESEEKHRLLVTQMSQGLIVNELVLDDEQNILGCRILDANDSYLKMFKRKREEIVNTSISKLQPHGDKEWLNQCEETALTGSGFHHEMYSKELGIYLDIVTYSPKKYQFVNIITDITDRKELEIALEHEKSILETTLLSVGDGVISTDNNGRIMFINKEAEKLTGWEQREAKDKHFKSIFNTYVEKTSSQLDKEILEHSKEFTNLHKRYGSTVLVSKNGSKIYIERNSSRILNDSGKIIGAVTVFRDCSEKKKRQEQIEFLSYRDYLTGIYNRRFYEEELTRLDTGRNLPLTIVMGDVNGLKLINDSLGHNAGDKLLTKAAEVIIQGCRVDDIIARLGGDEFAIILPKTDAKEAERIIARIEELASKQKVEGIEVSVSFGYGTKTHDDENIHEIYQNAEDHMYKHKLYESSSMRSKTIDLIRNTLFEKSNRELKHSQRVGQLCKEIATKMGMSKDNINQMYLAGLMHDIGKMGIDEKILNKTSSLTHEEWEEMKKHPEIGYRILSSVNEFSLIAKEILEHHERYDGRGYPKGLKGTEISLHARIITVADAFDAMTGVREYVTPITEEDAIEELKRCSGMQFDPEIVKVFIEQVIGIK